jgi:hypothetical protein
MVLTRKIAVNDTFKYGGHVLSSKASVVEAFKQMYEKGGMPPPLCSGCFDVSTVLVPMPIGKDLRALKPELEPNARYVRLNCAVVHMGAFNYALGTVPGAATLPAAVKDVQEKLGPELAARNTRA